MEPVKTNNAWGRRVLLAFCLGMLILLLLVEGFTTKTIGVAGTGARSVSGSPLARYGPVLVSDGHGGLTSHQPPAGRRIALTFDDGPSSNWTAQIAAILHARHIPATFFEVGSQVVRHPDVTAMLHRDGFQLGNHTFTHASLSSLPLWEAKMQLSLTESAISGITGIKPRLVRPPYSSTTDAVTPAQARRWGSLAANGYIIAVANYDTQDWERPGVSTIISNVLSEPAIRRGVGGIVLMHDAGGDRSQTVAALPRLIAALQARGFRFSTVSALAGIPAGVAEVPASAAQRLRGSFFDRMLALAGTLTNLLTRLVMLITILVGLRMIIGVILARVQVARVRPLQSLDFAPAVSILVPAHNEQVGIGRTVRSLAHSRYAGELEVIVVDDGSTDQTAQIIEGLIAQPDRDSDAPGLAGGLARVRLLRQANAGKAAALNHALAHSRNEIIVTVDGDTVFEPDTLALLVQRFREPNVGAISGNTKVGNRRGLIGRWQHIEYVMGFNLDRRMYEVLGCTPTVPGAIGAFRRQALADIGGVSGATLAEDTDVTLDIGRAGWRVLYEERARAWTEAPSGVRALYRQRSRWAFGTIQSMWKHRQALWSTASVGDGADASRRRLASRGARAVLVIAVFQVLLPLSAPLIDLFAIYSIVFLDPMPILAYWGAFNVFQILLAWSAFGLDGESRKPLWALPLQQFLHRQISYLVVYDAVISALLGTRLTWRHSKRTGDVQVHCQQAQPAVAGAQLTQEQPLLVEQEIVGATRS
jgi:cellulose synthase/poly-beta-1,6-N-acetylglucosamine synthase-like glycosyltransferase/peptidoglycan/xylan/chitin deacetylase (PgdA/CDA1 family)